MGSVQVFSYLSYLAPVATLFVMIRLRMKNAREPHKITLGIPAEYTPPDDLRPGEVGLLWDMHTNTQDILAEVLFIASKDYIRFERVRDTSAPGSAFHLDDVRIVSCYSDFSELREKDKLAFELMWYIFHQRSDPEPVLFSTLRSYRRDWLDLIDDIQQKSLIEKGYIRSHTTDTRKKYYALGGMIALFPIVLLVRFFEDLSPDTWLIIPMLISFSLCGIIILLFAPWMVARTQKGVAMVSYLTGFKQYLETAEKARLEFHDDPEKNMVTFDPLLPYAVALGVDTQWKHDFGYLFSRTSYPDWYYYPNEQKTWKQKLMTHVINFGATRQSIARRVRAKKRNH